MDALRAAPVRVVALILGLQAVAYYAVASRQELTPAIGPLTGLPETFDGWAQVQEFPLEPEVQAVLRADDTLNRVYVRPEGPTASLFIAYFKTQRFGQAPHSPKNCLPGSGWEPADDSKISMMLPGRAEPASINLYVIARGDQKSVVLYWYQSHSRVIASELKAKFWLVADAVRERRSDTALVRVIVPVRGEVGEAQETAASFVRSAYPSIVRQLPH